MRIKFNDPSRDQEDNDIDFEVIIAPNDTRKTGSISLVGAPHITLAPPEVKVESGGSPVVSLSVPIFVRNGQKRRREILNLTHSMQRHHYLRLELTGHAEERNSVMHRDLGFDLVKQDTIGLGEQMQVSAKSINDVIKQYSVGSRAFIVDSPIHFFVISGSKVWGGVSKYEWLAIRSIRRLDVADVTPREIRKMMVGELPRTRLVNDAVNAFRVTNADMEIAQASGKSQIVNAIRAFVDWLEKK
jgi:hypothetical protein